MSLSNIEVLTQLISLITQSSQGNDVIINQIQNSINFIAENEPKAIEDTLQELRDDTATILEELDTMTTLLASIKLKLNCLISKNPSEI